MELRYMSLWVACYTISTTLFIPSNHDLYEDNRLIIVENCTARKGDIIRKRLHWLFDKFGFKLDIQTN